MTVAIEESPELIFELWELLFIGVALIVLAVVIHHMDCFLFEEFADFGVVVNHLSQICLFKIGIQCLISHAHIKQHSR